MAKSRNLPDALRVNSGQRTDAAILALDAALEQIKAEVAANGFRSDPIRLADVVQRAGLGEKFLYGKKHRDTTKLTVEKQIQSINNRLVAKLQIPTDGLTDLEIAKQEAAYWKRRFDKLANQYNFAFARVRDLQRIVREYRVLSDRK